MPCLRLGLEFEGRRLRLPGRGIYPQHCLSRGSCTWLTQAPAHSLLQRKTAPCGTGETHQRERRNALASPWCPVSRPAEPELEQGRRFAPTSAPIG